FWKAKGVSGFRFDVVNLISKPDKYEDDTIGDGRRFYTDGPRIHQYLKELVEAGGIAGDMTVGEMSSTSLDNCVRYANPDEKELKMVFSFHHLKIDYLNGQKWALKAPDYAELRALFKKWQEGMQDANAWNALFWCNHDQPRAVSRFGDDKNYWKESARSLAMLIHLMRGTPYIYQGEEIGMTNAYFTDIDQYRDVESTNYFRILTEGGTSKEEALDIIAARSRDNGRTPMQWDGTAGAGFTTGTPWLGIPDNHVTINAEAEENDPTSIYAFYKELVRLRKEMEIIADGQIRYLDSGHDSVLAYERTYGQEKLTVVCSLAGEELLLSEPISLEGKKVLLSSYLDEPTGTMTALRPYESIAIYEN
ncbi:MAG: alpha,alpha-phosphotrehalase, partial [Lachnospiraceae bacterium]|nr:alpha,alpha-phosphotrehalase [Lachnospiraceae bacterium]